MTRVAFLVLAHTNPFQIRHLVNRLETGGHKVFIHYDRRSGDDLSIIHDRLIPQRISAFHGGFSLVRATLLLMHAAMEDSSYDYFMLLSGQCFPVNGNSWLVERLKGGKLFISYHRMPVDLFAKRLDRLEHFYFEGSGLVRKTVNRVARKLPKRDFVKGMSVWPYCGSQWWCLPNEVVKYILGYVDRFPSYVRFMSTTAYSDEVFFHSIISNMAIEERMAPALFYARFDPKTNRPVIFGTPEAPISEIPREHVFVARKFDSRLSDAFLTDQSAHAA